MTYSNKVDGLRRKLGTLSLRSSKKTSQGGWARQGQISWNTTVCIAKMFFFLRYRYAQRYPCISPCRVLVHDIASTLLLDIGTLSDLIYPVSLWQQFRDPRFSENSVVRNVDPTKLDVSVPGKRTARRLKLLKALAGALLSIGFGNSIEDICKDKLGVVPSMASVGITGSA